MIDSHVHVWSADPRAYPFQPLLAHVPAPTVPAPVERLLEQMDGAHVDKAILVQPSAYGADHRYLRRCLETWPDRFAGICQVDPRAGVPTDDLRRLCADGLYRGVRLNTIRQGDLSWLAAPARADLFELVEKLGLSLSFHMDLDQAPIVAKLAARHHRTAVIIDYLGPDVYSRRNAETLLDLLAAQSNVHFKLLCAAEDAASVYPFPDIAAFYGKVLARFGPMRVMFGSDYPGAARVCSYDRLIAWGENFPGLRPQDKTQIMGGTAQRLFHRPRPKT